MDQQTLDRAHQIISDRPGITRSELADAMSVGGPKVSIRSADRIDRKSVV